MIKGLHEITIADFDLMEQTGRISQFKKSWNILPSFLFVKQISGLVTEISKRLNDKEVTNKDEIDKYKLKSLDKINDIEINLQYLYLTLIIQINLEQIAKITNLKLKIKPIDNEKLKNTLKEIEELTGITVNETNVIEKMQEIRAEIEFLKDKFKENYLSKKPDESKKQQKISLAKFAGVYVLYLNGDLKGLSKMLIVDLLTIKELADEKYIKEEQHKMKLKNV